MDDHEVEMDKVFVIKLTQMMSIAILSLSIVGCSFLLPSRKVEKNDHWSSFEQVQDVYNEVQPNQTQITKLKKLEFDPFVATNVKIDEIRPLGPLQSLDDLITAPAVGF